MMTEYRVLWWASAVTQVFVWTLQNPDKKALNWEKTIAWIP